MTVRAVDRDPVALTLARAPASTSSAYNAWLSVGLRDGLPDLLWRRRTA